ncbi:unnamed protein product [Cuscuta epithymum]|uniref:Chromo domain-containing protein n=1 Tax=Cuscuta epithymum TaxID=186058 RepID=A0AAV0ED28_9ASTE|nr:unnamed protein product [Cuscuta epithymum]
MSDTVSSKFPAMNEEGNIILLPAGVLARRIVKRNNAVVVQWLIKWAHLQQDEATWEDYDVIIKQFPEVKAWGQALEKEGGNVTIRPSIFGPKWCIWISI